MARPRSHHSKGPRLAVWRHRSPGPAGACPRDRRVVPWCGPAIVAAPPVPPAQRLPVQPVPMPALAPWLCGQAARSEGRRARDHPARRLALRTLGRARSGPSKGAAGGGGVGGGPLAWTAVGGCKPGQLAQPSAMLLREAPIVSGLGRSGQSPKLVSCIGGGRVPSTMSRHAGHVCQPSVWSKARASAARCRLGAPPPPLASKQDFKQDVFPFFFLTAF